MKDLIERQAAIDAVLSVIPYDEYWKEEVEKAINTLPSAQPERKTGKWIHGRDGWECSGCRCLVEEENKPPYNFCPQCGTYVRGDET